VFGMSKFPDRLNVAECGSIGLDWKDQDLESSAWNSRGQNSNLYSRGPWRRQGYGASQAHLRVLLDDLLIPPIQLQLGVMLPLLVEMTRGQKESGCGEEYARWNRVSRHFVEEDQEWPISWEYDWQEEHLCHAEEYFHELKRDLSIEQKRSRQK
jgi:hypothetical protein